MYQVCGNCHYQNHGHKKMGQSYLEERDGLAQTNGRKREYIVLLRIIPLKRFLLHLFDPENPFRETFVSERVQVFQILS